MNLDIKGTNLELTPAVKDYIEEKISGLSKLVGKWDKVGAVSAKFELARTTNHHNKGEVYYAEVNVNLDGKLVRAEASGEDPRAAVDKVKDVIKKEISKLKEKEDDKNVGSITY